MRRPSASQTKTESPVPVRWMARTQSASDVPGRDGHGLAATEGPQSLFGDGRDAPRDGGFGEIGHVLKCSASPG